jgi:hypothetical protein
MQSVANPSLKANSRYQGKIQGIPEASFSSKNGVFVYVVRFWLDKEQGI